MSLNIPIPNGLEIALLMILADHTGREQSVNRTRLVNSVRGIYPGVRERTVRQAIHELRRKGNLICSAPGADGGYYLAGSLDEYKEFIQRELHSRAMDLLETEKAMNAGAQQKFGEAVQIGLL